MKKKISVVVANPAGNVTIFVMDRFGREDYSRVARQLLEMEELGGEQVAFVCDAEEGAGTETGQKADGKIEMCGLEFCGNASRSYGLLLAREMGIEGRGRVNIDMSGCEEILTIEVDTCSSDTKVKMPMPGSIENTDLSSLPIGDGTGEHAGSDISDISGVSDISGNLKKAQIVDFGGIIHVVLKGIEPSRKNFDMIKDKVLAESDAPAMGVMFCSREDDSMVPVVYVKDVDSTYFEGSCGSGTTACAAAFAAEMGDGCHRFSFSQPGGTIDAQVIKKDGKLDSIFIQGEVKLSEKIIVEIEA